MEPHYRNGLECFVFPMAWGGGGRYLVIITSALLFILARIYLPIPVTAHLNLNTQDYIHGGYLCGYVDLMRMIVCACIGAFTLTRAYWQMR